MSWATMPETTVDEDRNFVIAKSDVDRASSTRDRNVKAVAVPLRPECPTKNEFRLRVEAGLLPEASAGFLVQRPWVHLVESNPVADPNSPGEKSSHMTRNSRNSIVF